MRIPLLKRTFAMAVAMVAGTAVFTATPAYASSYKGCVYPRVCFYLTDADWAASSPTAAYQDVTDVFQNLGSKSRGAKHVMNTRNDDRVILRYLRYGETYYECLEPNTGRSYPSYLTVTGIMIQTASSCN
ncbi:hypothetical protein OHB14_59765 [Streptomyces sp. NBC_01613]|uniref:hypothetical protein n=1 Tax=Streptomyces sp. NBC_01613 TaxID=2975896 RepID=UPI0038691D40